MFPSYRNQLESTHWFLYHGNNWSFTAWKVSKYGVISGLYLLVFRLSTEIYLVNLCIQSEYRKIQTKNNSVVQCFFSLVDWRSPCKITTNEGFNSLEFKHCAVPQNKKFLREHLYFSNSIISLIRLWFESPTKIYP